MPHCDRMISAYSLHSSFILEPISKILAHEGYQATEMGEAREVGGVILMARQDARKLLQLDKQEIHNARLF